MGSRKKNWDLYPSCLREMARVCRPGSGKAVLLTQDKKCFSKVNIVSAGALFHEKQHVLVFSAGNALHTSGSKVTYLSKLLQTFACWLTDVWTPYCHLKGQVTGRAITNACCHYFLMINNKWRVLFLILDLLSAIWAAMLDVTSLQKLNFKKLFQENVS